MGEGCCGGHGHDHGHEEKSFNMEDVVANNNMLLNTLIDLLIEKDVISEEELMKKLEEQVQEAGEGCNCDDEGCDCGDDSEDEDEEESSCCGGHGGCCKD